MNAVLYSKDDCQWCDRVRMLLDSVKISYKEYKYQKHFTKEQFYNEFGEGATFPQVAIGSKHIGGCKETLNYLKSKELL